MFPAGFHRGLDTAGATLGPLFTILLLKHFNDNLRPIFFLALIPAFLGILFLLFFVKEKKKETKRFIFGSVMALTACVLFVVFGEGKKKAT
ncbi:MAG: hypothetical protein KJ935_05370 [Candidatus Omnitrophica bacterium]|nr:hypothetical protein [Candidatus Omnitrophota bacterium]